MPTTTFVDIEAQSADGGIVSDRVAFREDGSPGEEECILCDKKVPTGQRLDCTEGAERIAVVGAICKACLPKAMRQVRRAHPNAKGKLVSLSGRAIV